MKKVRAMLIALVAGLTIIIGCGLTTNSEEVNAWEKERQAKSKQNDVNEVMEHLQYMKDTRTGICFAYYWGGAGNGGPALATVPCEAVPSGMLWTAK